MNKLYSEFSHVLKSNPEQISTLLNEYRSGHRAIAPKAFFIDMTCNADEQMGALVSIKMNVSGIMHEFYELTAKPIPTRIIIEFDIQMDAVIAIVVEATDHIHESLITISTFSTSSPYLLEFLDSLLVSDKLRQIFHEELPYLMNVDILSASVLQAV